MSGSLLIGTVIQIRVFCVVKCKQFTSETDRSMSSSGRGVPITKHRVIESNALDG